MDMFRRLRQAQENAKKASQDEAVREWHRKRVAEEEAGLRTTSTESNTGGLSEGAKKDFRESLQTYPGEPGNNPAIYQMSIWYGATFKTDVTGKLFNSVLQFIYDSIDDQERRHEYCFHFLKSHWRHLPESAKAFNEALGDRIFKEW